MKRKYIVFGLFAASSIYGFSQQADTAYSKKKIAKSTIQVIYGHYIQNGNHSAVTGGIGTEKLQVYSPEISIKREIDSLRSYQIDMGVDVVSSASTDKIDFVVSSASKVDGHAYLTIGYNRKLKKNKHITLGGSGQFAIESDYLSFGGVLSASAFSKDRSKEYYASLETFLDDLRWGRLNGIRPLKLVYPQELRYKEWYNEYRRRSFNLNLGFQQTINKKMLLGIFPGISYQQGLLATPFQRVYFTDSSLKVENLPGRRLKIPLGIQFNTFIGDRFILRNYYRYYWDDFGITAHTLNVEFAAKLSPGFTLTPLIRLYTQTASPHFKKFREHQLQERFYTSDYDLSAFQSYEAGLEMRFAGIGKGEEITYLNNVGIRYSYYKRTDGLYAHIITILLDFVSQKKHGTIQIDQF